MASKGKVNTTGSIVIYFANAPPEGFPRFMSPSNRYDEIQ